MITNRQTLSFHVSNGMKQSLHAEKEIQLEFRGIFHHKRTRHDKDALSLGRRLRSGTTMHCALSGFHENLKGGVSLQHGAPGQGGVQKD